MKIKELVEKVEKYDIYLKNVTTDSVYDRICEEEVCYRLINVDRDSRDLYLSKNIGIRSIKINDTFISFKVKDVDNELHELVLQVRIRPEI